MSDKVSGMERWNYRVFMDNVFLKKIYCIGGANIDYKFKTQSPLVFASSYSVKSYKTLGGVARNVAENLAHLTSEVYFQSVVGNDSEGNHLIQQLSDKKINTSSCLTLSGFPTAHYYAILDNDNNLFIAIADMEIYEHIPFATFSKSWDLWENNSIVFLDTNLSLELIEYAIASCKHKQIQLCIDPVSVEKSTKLPQDLSHIYLLKPNQEEASALAGLPISNIDDCYLAGSALLKRGVQNLVISLGNKGYVVMNATTCEHYPAQNTISVTDPNGAGDAFISGILLGLQKNLPLLEACQLGAKAALLVIQSLDSSLTMDKTYVNAI
jgi:pseudouridine kinase